MSACDNNSNLDSREDSCGTNSYGMSAPQYYPPLNKGVYGSTMIRYKNSESQSQTNHLNDLSLGDNNSVPDYFNWLDENSRKSVGLNENLSSHFDYAINQGTCGCCWAIATVTSLGHRYAIQLAKKKYKVSGSLILSALELLSANTCGSDSIKEYAEKKLNTIIEIPQNQDDPNAHCVGGNVQVAADWLSQNKITLNKCWVYHTPQMENNVGWDTNNQYTNFKSLVGVAGCTACKKAEIAQLKVGVQGEPQVGMNNNDIIKADIYENGPVATTMATPDNFQKMWFEGNENDIIRVNGNGNPGKGHSVVIVGWGNDNGGYWIVQNSWGKSDNRPNGTFKINFDNGIGIGKPRCEEGECRQRGGVVSFLPTDASSDDIKLLIAAQLISPSSGTTPNIKPTIVTPSPPPPPNPNPTPKKKEKKEKHDYTGLILVLLLLAGMGIIGYTIYKKRHKGKRRRKRK